MRFSARQAAEWCDGRLETADAADYQFDGMDTLDRAGPTQLTFIGHAVYAPRLAKSSAGGALCRAGLEVSPRPDQVLIRVENADLAVAKILEKLAPPPPFPPVGIHPSACVHPTARIGGGVCIGPMVVIDADAEIGIGSILMAQCYVGPGVKIGENCVLWPQVVVRDGSELGDRVVLHPRSGVLLDGVGGNFMTVSTAEINTPIYENILRGVAFIDAGDVEPNMHLGIIRIDAGVGVRVIIPFLGRLPLGIDLAYPIQRGHNDHVEYISFAFGLPM